MHSNLDKGKERIKKAAPAVGTWPQDLLKQ
jgi:hypothetical protein